MIFVCRDSLNCDDLKVFLGNKLDWNGLSKLLIDNYGPNHQVWLPTSSIAKITNLTYKNSNQGNISS